MIQRLQSLWLLLAACCLSVCFFAPLAQYEASMPNTGQHVETRLDLVSRMAPDMHRQLLDGVETLQYSQKMSGFKVWPLTVLVAACAIGSLACIFLFRNRKIQMRMVAVVFMLNVVVVLLVFLWAVDGYADALATRDMTNISTSWHFSAFMPIVSLALLFLAQRGIRLDEAKVRAADRLR
ncbi:MAG: DUF4293 domain-containing protein [Bacteroidales bacterium]|nr:DUF4293 domain-containing protein [Bacteroidales bacterium]